jgi:predicted AlkP superfamily phosphohydrolase/phosphomutase
VWPPEYLPTFDAALAGQRAEEEGADPSTMLEADRIITRSAVDLAGADYDLILVYVRGVDISCHFNWKYFEPANFPGVDPETLAEKRELIAREYEFVDRKLGDLMAAAGPESNIVVMSDHGFDAMEEETTKILINFDIVLERLGFLTMADDGVDLEHSRLYSYASPNRSLTKHVRFALAGRDPGGRVTADQRSRIRQRFTEKLAGVTYSGGAPAFSVRDASREEIDKGADFVVDVLTEGAQQPLRYSGKNIRGAIRSLTRLSGTHGRKTPGIFIAAGPDFEPGVNPTDLRVIDVPPTVLYALGLPVGEDFAGRARIDLFTEGFRAAHELQTIPTWGEPIDGENRASDVDEELVDQLKALGYIE